jgi:esterase/lipase superfamily enzyme
MFDHIFMAAADIVDDAFDPPVTNSLAPLCRLGRRITVLHNRHDQVLDKLSETLNFCHRLGQDGPRGGGDTILFPPATYRRIDCSGFTDYDTGFAGSHQYYRRSAGVRTEIAALMGA